MTPAAYARSLRAERLKSALEEGGSVTGAIYEAGYNAPSRAYADAERHLGMTPSAWKDGGRGAAIRHAVVPTRSEEHTSELQSLMRISYAVFCLKKNK